MRNKQAIGGDVNIDLDWLCPDGYVAQLSYPEDKYHSFTVQCFSGIPESSEIVIDPIDLSTFRHWGVEITDDYEQNALNVANYLCQKLGLEPA